MSTEEFTKEIYNASAENKNSDSGGVKVIKKIKFLNGKKVIKRTCSKDGFRYDPKTKRCIKLSPQELKKMKIANKKRVRKMAKKMAIILRKRKKSMAIRKSRMGE